MKQLKIHYLDNGRPLCGAAPEHQPKKDFKQYPTCDKCAALLLKVHREAS